METGVMPGETSIAMAAFPERVRWDGVACEAVKGRLGIRDAQSAREDERHAREAKLASAAKCEAMIDLAVEWVAARLRTMMA